MSIARPAPCHSEFPGRGRSDSERGWVSGMPPPQPHHELCDLAVPEDLTPDISAAEYVHDPRAIAITEAAHRLVELRDRGLNPPEWVEWVEWGG